MVWPPVLAESTNRDVVFVSFAPPRTVKTANINENTAMIKSRMVAGVKILLYTEKTKLFFASSPILLFSLSFSVLFVITSVNRPRLENFSCPKIKQKSLHIFD